MTVKEFDERLATLLSAGDDIYRHEDESCYVHKETRKRLYRTTTFLSGGVPFNLPEIWKGCLPIGSDADQLARDYFVEGDDACLFNIQSGTYRHLTERAAMQLLTDLRDYDKAITEEGWVCHADRVFLYSLELGVAGEVDFLFSNRKKKVIAVSDMKTSRAGLASFDRRYKKGEKSKREKYGLQLNTYRVMAEELSGLKVAHLEIAAFKVFYPKFRDVTDECYLETRLPVEINKNVLEDIAGEWVKHSGQAPPDLGYEPNLPDRPEGESSSDEFWANLFA
jgi:hypothetical protein